MRFSIVMALIFSLLGCQTTSTQAEKVAITLPNGVKVSNERYLERLKLAELQGLDVPSTQDIMVFYDDLPEPQISLTVYKDRTSLPPREHAPYAWYEHVRQFLISKYSEDDKFEVVSPLDDITSMCELEALGSEVLMHDCYYKANYVLELKTKSDMNCATVGNPLVSSNGGLYGAAIVTYCSDALTTEQLASGLQSTLYAAKDDNFFGRRFLPRG
ncbi:hypothetical protein [Vibrio sp. TBV020]|uniref:hypothetical protein n=1 Tax=Vibrio sp. TBV020 TaxID=3137398 RepID=UPI0038CDC738